MTRAQPGASNTKPEPPKRGGRQSSGMGGVSWGSDGRGELPERAVELTSHFHERPAIAPGQFGRQPENGGEQGQVQA